MPPKQSNNKTPKSIETLTHSEDKRPNIPTAEYQSVMEKADQAPVRVAYERRNRDLDPQLVWRGKDEQDWSDLVVQAPPLYIQEKVHPKVLIDDLARQTQAQAEKGAAIQLDLFADFNGLPDEASKTEFYQHDANWTNRMILGDSLQVMASLAEREGMRGKVQCIYIDPPYGIKFNSNFQWSTKSRDVKDGNADHITREPEQVKAFRDTWRDGIHSYLTYLRDRLTVARDLLTESGSIFVQIGDENVHRVRALMDEVLGGANFCSEIFFWKTSSATSRYLAPVGDVLVWYAKDIDKTKFRQPYTLRTLNDGGAEYKYDWKGFGEYSSLNLNAITGKERLFRPAPSTSQTPSEASVFSFVAYGRTYTPGNRGWSTSQIGMLRALRADRLVPRDKSISYVRFFDDQPAIPVTNLWLDTRWGFDASDKRYVVETNPKVIQRCILMATDPGDLVLDPTCGSGTTAYVAEQWGRRWITIDTSRVALALARARIMGARYPYYLLADSKEGREKEWQVTSGQWPEEHQPLTTSHYSLRQGFVYERVPHITLKSIANNAEIDVIWERYEKELAPIRSQISKILSDHQPLTTDHCLEEWEIPRERPEDWPPATQPLLTAFWQARIARQKEIDASIAAKAEFEYLYDKPYEDKKTVRVAGPFTVESLSPHRVLAVGADDELIDPQQAPSREVDGEAEFVRMILENLKTAGVQQAHKEDKVVFTSLTPWPGDYICAEGHYVEGGGEVGPIKRAGIFIGPEFGTVSRDNVVGAAREAGDADFDVLITCAFNYDAHSADLSKLGRIQILKARMNADLHMAEDLKNTGKGNLFVIFGEPDIEIKDAGKGQIRVKIKGVDVFHPNTGEVRSDGAEGIACWFIDTDYNNESFFVRQAYFLGANDPYKALKTSLKTEVNEEAWESLHSDTSRPFDKPTSGRIAVKVINHLGDEVMKVFEV